MSTSINPYTSNNNRLSDVIAAIQVMATYKYYKLNFKKWADRIEGDESKGEYWRRIFVEHPEFFRLDKTHKKASLVWRRNYPKRYDVDKGVEISLNEFKARKVEGNLSRTSRMPLNNDDISLLVNTAVELHTHEIKNKQESRWWVPVLVGFIGIILGVILEKL